MSRILTSSDDVFEPLLLPSRIPARRSSSGWLLAGSSALVGAVVSTWAIVAVPPDGSTRTLLFTLMLALAAGVAGSQRIKFDERTLQPAPTLVFVVCAAIVLGPAAAIAVGAAAALATSRSPLPSLVFHLALSAAMGSAAGLVAHEALAAFPGLNIVAVTMLVASSAAAVWSIGELAARVMRGMGRSFPIVIVAAEVAEFLIAVAFSPALIVLFRTAGLGAASLLAAALISLFVAFRIYRDRLLRLHAEITHMSRTDPLTGIGNRRAFDERLDEELGRATRTGRPFGLLLIDIDHFKQINDNHGHEIGDSVPEVAL